MGVVLLWSGEKNISNRLKPVNLLNPLLLFSSVEDFYSFKVEMVVSSEEELVLLEKKLGSASCYFFWVQQPEESPNLSAEEMNSANKKSAKWRHLNISTSNFHLKNKNQPTFYLSQQDIFFHSKSSTEKSESHHHWHTIRIFPATFSIFQLKNNMVHRLEKPFCHREEQKTKKTSLHPPRFCPHDIWCTNHLFDA